MDKQPPGTIRTVASDVEMHRITIGNYADRIAILEASLLQLKTGLSKDPLVRMTSREALTIVCSALGDDTPREDW